MNFGVYVHYVNKFVMLYNRLPSLEEQQKAKRDFDENRVYNLARKISDTLKTNKTPCERCRDYFAYKAYDTQEDFMQGTFKNRSEAEQIASSSVIAYQPLTPIGTFTTVSDKTLSSMQYNLLSDEELAYQLALYNTLERTSLEPIDEDAFTLQVMLWFNPELVCKPYVEYQYALFYKMLYGEPSTRYARVLDIDGKVTKLRIAQMLATQSKGNVTFTARDLDDVIARIQHPVSETIQRGLMAFDLDMEGVHMQAEVSHLDALTGVLSALAGLSSQELLTIQRAKTERELQDAVRQIAVRVGQMPIASDQPVPEQQIELTYPYRPENVRGYRQILSLVFYIKKLCTETHQIIPFLRATGEVIVNETNGQIARAQPVPTSLRNSRRWILPYLEYTISGGTIKNLSDAQIVRQVQEVFAR